MVAYKRANNIYNLFWAERVNEIIFGVKLVENLKNSPNSSTKIYKRVFPIVLCYAILCCYNIYDLMNKTNLNLFEFCGIPLTVMFIIIDVTIWLDCVKIKKGFSRAIDLLDVMDNILAKCFRYESDRKARLLLIDLLMTLSIILLAIITPIFILLFLISSYTKTFILIQISVLIFHIFLVYLMIIRLLIIDRLKTLNMVIKIQAQKFGSKRRCQWCDQNHVYTKYKVCEKHIIM